MAKELAEQLHALDVKAEIFQADLSQYGDVRRLHKEVVEKLGHPEVLYNNHGIASPTRVKGAEDISIDDFEKTWRTNTGSSYLLTQLCLPAMEERGWGRVIFCSSVAGLTGGLVGPHYACAAPSQSGLHWLTSGQLF